MRIVAVAVATLVGMAAGADLADVERLKRELRVAAPPEQYPDHAEYVLLPPICNDKICFKGLVVRFFSVGDEIIRLAIFSESGHYIGSYDGLNLAPTAVDGATVLFPASTHGNKIHFNRTSPPAEIRIDGETHAFRSAR